MACQSDPRFSYCLHVPNRRQHLCVYVHGTERDAAFYRTHLTEFAEEHNCIILCPVFPGGLIEPDDLDNYKNLRFYDIAYDHVLLNMVDEIQRRYGISIERFLLGGFSGGAQFAHRFYYLYPHRLQGLSAAAPGRVSLLSSVFDWWVGVRNFEALFGCTLDMGALRQVPVQILSGELDTTDSPIEPSSRYWMDGANFAGSTRLSRAETLSNNYREHGISTEFTIVPGVGHKAPLLMKETTRFFSEILKGRL